MSFDAEGSKAARLAELALGKPIDQQHHQHHGQGDAQFQGGQRSPGTGGILEQKTGACRQAGQHGDKGKGDQEL